MSPPGTTETLAAVVGFFLCFRRFPTAVACLPRLNPSRRLLCGLQHHRLLLECCATEGSIMKCGGRTDVVFVTGRGRQPETCEEGGVLREFVCVSLKEIREDE
ncbi:hypothetical protein L1987_29878 [Smallanthus sonchifolius]|uniref:Uncharacterized protein n=1 Tax=Smallanthus sonchifolius TaxID=185202 RepID=A0ACB9I159_9ASTR|nr:hypothetical protein L1987_29878 [Smallanthus sonchifolius]